MLDFLQSGHSPMLLRQASFFILKDFNRLFTYLDNLMLSHELLITF
jgi:hypothetical protein